MSKSYLGRILITYILTFCLLLFILCNTQHKIQIKMNTNIAPESPGSYLERKFMIPNGLTQNKLARDLDVDTLRIWQIIHNRRSITADTALRFAKYFKTTARFWLELQLEFDLHQARMRSEAVINISVRNNPLF